MASRKVYYNENDSNYPELTAHRNDRDELYVCLGDGYGADYNFTTIPHQDAIELIIDLAEQFGLKIESPQK